MNALSCDGWKTSSEVIFCLMAKHRKSSSAGSVILFYTLLEYSFEEVDILVHADAEMVGGLDVL